MAALLLLAIVAMNLWLNTASYKKYYSESLAASYAVAAGSTQRTIEYAVKYGKPLDNFYGMPELLYNVKKTIAEVEDVRIILPNNMVAWTIDGSLRGAAAWQKGTVPDIAGISSYKLLRDGSTYHTVLPLRDKTGKVIGGLDIVVDEKIIDNKADQFYYYSLPGTIFAAIAGMAVLFVLFLAVPLHTARGELRRKVFLGLTLAVLSMTQLAIGYHNLFIQQDTYRLTAVNNTLIAARTVNNDLYSLIAKAGSYSQVGGLHEWLAKVAAMIPEVDNLVISEQDRVIAAAKPDKAAVVLDEESPWIYRIPVSYPSGSGDIHVVLSAEYINSKIMAIAMDTLTMTLISCFFAVEILLLLLLMTKRQEHTGRTLDHPGTAAIRPLAFIFYNSFFITISFIPIYMKQIAQPVPGWPLPLILGLPISAEFIATAAAALIGGFLIDRKGWKFLLYGGLFWFVAGSLLSWLAESMVMFILARAVTGLGYGFVWMALRGAVAAAPSQLEKTEGFSALNAGIFAANLCGCAFGAILADRMGFSRVFLLAGVLGVVAIAAAAFLLPHAGKQTQPARQARVKQGKAGDFFADRQVVVFFLCIIIPSAACMVGFLQYYFPLYVNSAGLATANAGRAFMVYAVCIVYLGPFIARRTGKLPDVSRAVIAAAGVGTVSMLVFAWMPSLLTAYGAVLLLGLADSIGLTAQNAYFLRLQATQKLGEGAALGMYSTVWKLGQMAGPIVFGLLLPWGEQLMMAVVGLLYGTGVAAFWFARQRRLAD